MKDEGGRMKPAPDPFFFILHPSYFILTPMIALTRLNGKSFVINAEKIRYVESTPDTVVCCDNGEKMMVRETLQEVMKRAIEYARVIRRAVTE
jgi:flagellar protein FlbD